MNNVKDWLDEWCLLYPENIEFNGHKLRVEAKYCYNKMLKLCQKKPTYTKDVIFAATKLYLSEQQAKDWAYTRRANYFISKLGEPSLLESYCEKILNKTEVINIATKTEDYYNPMSDFIN